MLDLKILFGNVWNPVKQSPDKWSSNRHVNRGSGVRSGAEMKTGARSIWLVFKTTVAG